MHGVGVRPKDVGQLTQPRGHKKFAPDASVDNNIIGPGVVRFTAAGAAVIPCAVPGKTQQAAGVEVPPGVSVDEGVAVMTCLGIGHLGKCFRLRWTLETTVIDRLEFSTESWTVTAATISARTCGSLIPPKRGQGGHYPIRPS